ncbi:hypothetical protein EGP98_05640 [bacterium]|nr:hypothetical protein [bacterium]
MTGIEYLRINLKKYSKVYFEFIFLLYNNPRKGERMMKKFTDFIVEHKNIILIIFVFLTGISLYGSTKVNINSDITKYLPKTSETRIGKDIMDSSFKEQKSSELNVMFKGLTSSEKEETLEKLEKITGVSKVLHDDSEEYNNGEYTLYTLKVDDYDHSKTAENVYNEVVKNYDYKAMSGSIYNEYKPVLKLWIVALAIGMAMVILTFLSKSYIEPWLYLISIGIAVFINKGTNIIFPSVSNITDSITAILQLALSMDYSIMLSNRYRQEREKTKDKNKAMKQALFDSFKAISSSSVTTVVGLLALVFMSFTIGKDLGFVLAKGVFLSLVSIFFCLPGLLLLFDKQIINSKKKALEFNLTKLGKFSYKTRWAQLIIIIVAFISAYLLKGNLGILYTDSEQDEVGKHFKATNQITIIYENQYEDIMAKYCKSLKNDKKANQVLCYSNTINQKLAYNELNAKFKELGQDTELDDYLIKLIYYNYYNKNTNDSMSLDEFIKFIKSDIYTNPKLASAITTDVKNNMTLLENFASKENVSKVRDSSEIASILGIGESEVNDLLILYNAKNINSKMTMADFVNFMLGTVVNNKTYASSIDNTTIASLKQLQPFTDKNNINRQMNQSEIASLFGLDEKTVNDLFLFARASGNSTTTMTINEFATIALSLKDNSSLSSMFNEEMVNKLTVLKTLSDTSNINKKYDSTTISNMLSKMGLTNLDSNTVSLLYFYNYYLNNSNSLTKLSLNTFVNEVLMDNNISSLLPASVNTYKPYLVKFSNKDFITTSLNKIDMYNELKNYGFSEEQINTIYMSIYKALNPNASNEEIITDTSLTLTPYKVISVALNSMQPTNTMYANLKLLVSIMNLSYNETYNVVPTYTYQELASYLANISSDITKETVGLGYSYYDYKTTQSSKKMSIKELVNFVVSNQNDTLIASKLGNNKDMLLLAYNIVNNTEAKYNYKELSKVISQDESLVKSVYGVADYTKLATTMSPLEFANLILNNKDNSLLASKLNKTTITKLNLVKEVMMSSLKDSKYTAKELANLLGSDSDTISLVMALYSSDSNTKISLVDFTDFIISDVLTNDKFSTRFDNEAKEKLVTINGIMKNTLMGSKYNSLELYNILNKLTNGLDYNLIDLVYIYHGSENLYDSSWRLTVEEIVNYLNDFILKDEKYKSFLDKEMQGKIISAKDTISTAKELLVSKKYSRAILNTKYGKESKDTLAFVQKTIDEVGNKKGIYVVGDSPMALEMSKSFNNELDFITILTILFIFVVVAFTFKDLLIPLMLVLIIQCAVYVTMAILSMTGSKVYFISLLIVQAILMGATIDYAIVYTTYYKESRETMNVQKAIINAYNKSIHTILSSSSILIIVTLIVSSFADAIAAKICETISQGTFCSVILILLILPGVLATCDKLICRKNVYKD